jgi:hypothetical protein
MRSVDIIFKSHSGADVHPGVRVFRGTKTELIHGCLRSLVRAVNNLDLQKYSVTFTVFDDHSTPECVTGIKKIISTLSCETKFIALDSRGVGPSLATTFEYAKNSRGESIYFVEDDYLHTETALLEMLEAQEIFSRNLGGREVAIFPLDYPPNYIPQLMQPSYLVVGPRRHFHTEYCTTGTFLISRKAFLENFDLCIKMGKYKIDPFVDEGSTFNKIWTDRGVTLFSPVPTLAIHMQGNDVMPPFTDWRKWWDSYAI